MGRTLRTRLQNLPAAWGCIRRTHLQSLPAKREETVDRAEEAKTEETAVAVLTEETEETAVAVLTVAAGRALWLPWR